MRNEQEPAAGPVEDPSPFQPPRQPSDEASLSPSKDPSIEHEPHMRSGGIRAQEVEEPLVATELEPELAQHSVWDEPSTGVSLAGITPESAITWYRHYQSRVDATPTELTWKVTLGVAMGSGLLAVVGALLFTPTGWAPVVLAAPFVEEILKVALVIWVVEKKPWLFQSGTQLIFCGFCAGLLFAVWENLLYINWYIPSASASLIAWRWTVCVLLHLVCSVIAAFGALQVWQRFQAERRPPRLSDGALYFSLAIAIHAVYNLLAVILQVSLAWF